MSTNRPSIAAAAAIRGLTRCVRPPLPCRPSKFRFEVEAQRSPSIRMSGFMPRHIEQPEARHSKPASRKTSWRPSCSAASRTCSEPGTTIARTPSATLPPADHRGGGAQVLDPRVRAGADEDAVELDLGDRRAGLERHVGERPLGGLGIDRAFQRRRVGDACGNLGDHAWVRPPGDHRRQRRRVDIDLGVELGTVVGRRAAAIRRRRRRSAPERRARPRTYSNVVSSGAIIPARPPPSIVMLQIVIRASIERSRTVSPAYSTT